MAQGAATAEKVAPAAEESPPAEPAVVKPSTIVSDPLLAERLKALEAKVKDMTAAEEKQQAKVDQLSKFKVAGFVQGRYEWHQDAANGWNFTNSTTGTKDYFYVRRARLDTVYSGINAEAVLQLDVAGASPAAKDMEAAFIDTWSPLHLRISVGQFKYPFGYELQQGDTAREMPERSRFILNYFPGERDRGIKVQGRYDILRFQVALINGNGTQDATFAALDSNNFKDVVGRIGVDHDFIVGGVSGWWGNDDLDTSATDKTTWLKFKRLRIGGDMQGYVDVPGLGNLALRGEAIYSRDKNQSYNGVMADSCKDRIGWGWSLIAAQNVGKYLGAIVRVDGYDPLLQGSYDSIKCAGSATKPGSYVKAGSDRVITYGGGLLGNVSTNLRLSLIYEHPSEQGASKVDNDVFTAQLLAKF
jgi:hypothetical protein